MKRTLPRAACALVLLSLLLCVQLCSCGAKYEVSFDLNYEGAGTMEPVQSGKKLAEPTAPVREGYVLLGWFKDAALSEKWDFGKDRVTGPITLYAGWDLDTGDSVQNPTDDKDFGKLRTPGSQESAYEYKAFFLPGLDGAAQPYVGDTMPYYEDGVFYVYYLKDGATPTTTPFTLPPPGTSSPGRSRTSPCWSPPAPAGRTAGLAPAPS